MKTNPDYSKTVYETCENCVYNSTGDVSGARNVGHPKCGPCRRYSNFAAKGTLTSRIDIIGQNGNDGEHYPKTSSFTMEGIHNQIVKYITSINESVMTPLFNRPKHYNGWDVARFADSRKYDLYQFNILKYIDRHERKDGKRDLLKAIDYLQEYLNVRYPEEK